MSSVGEQIERNGWKQGDVIKNDEFPASIEGQLENIDHLFVITTQSCDLVHHRLEDEPYAECIECLRIDKLKGDYTFAKNPRRLHLLISYTDGSEQPVEILAHRIYRFPREEMTTITPSADKYLSERNCKTLIRWLACRYDRPAFPDEFQIDWPDDWQCSAGRSRTGHCPQHLLAFIRPGNRTGSATIDDALNSIV
jgi:hypothetical protein